MGAVYEYGDGFDANGLQLTADEAHVIIIGSGTASLYRYTIDGGKVAAIATGHADLTGGDGLALGGDILSVNRVADLHWSLPCCLFADPVA